MGFLEDTVSATQKAGAAIFGFLNAGLDTAEAVKDRLDLFKVRIKDDDPLPSAQKNKSITAVIAENKESLYIFGAVAIIGTAMLFSAVNK